MDSLSLVLKKTVPIDLAENRKALENLVKPNYKQNPIQFLPFQALENVGEGNEAEKPFLLCAYNQTDMGTYRSPYTSRLFTTKSSTTGVIEVGSVTDAKETSGEEKEMRAMESAANEVWSSYVHLYYGAAGIGSAFLKSQGGNSFEGIFGVHKKTDKGSWDCVHVVQVEAPKGSPSGNYRVESAVMMSILPYEGSTISSTLNKLTTKSLKLRSSNLVGSHLSNLGKIMEDVEIEFRSKLERVDIPKSLEIMDAAYQKTNDASITSTMVSGADESEEPMNLTGMGVGSSLIGEIASMARKKHAEGNAFLDAMKAQQEARKASVQEGSSSPILTDTKKALKKTEIHKPSAPIASPDFLSQANLRKVKAPTRPASAPTSPTPEFLNFRSKLKKKGGAPQ